MKTESESRRGRESTSPRRCLRSRLYSDSVGPRLDYYAIENLSAAVENLIGPRPIHERLNGAASALSLLNHKPFDDQRHRESYEAIMGKLARWDEGALQAMSDEDAGAVAKEILRLYESCLTAQAREDVLNEVMRQDVGESE